MGRIVSTFASGTKPFISVVGGFTIELPFSLETEFETKRGRFSVHTVIHGLNSMTVDFNRSIENMEEVCSKEAIKRIIALSQGEYLISVKSFDALNLVLQKIEEIIKEE